MKIDKRALDDNLKKQIGKNIRLARTNARYTQEMLAEKTGVSARYISQLERGFAFGSPSTIISICNVLNVSADFLFGNLITQSHSASTELANDNFLKCYMQLNSNNRTLLKVIAKQLINFQTSTCNKMPISENEEID